MRLKLGNPWTAHMIETKAIEKSIGDIQLDSPEPTTTINQKVLWCFSELTALCLRLNDQHQQVEQASVEQLYFQLQQFDTQLQVLSRHENNLIHFLLRDWIMHLFAKSQSKRLIQMHHILRQGAITGSIVGRKRTIADITQAQDKFPTASICLNAIGNISPEYHTPHLPPPSFDKTKQPQDRFAQWLIPASTLWIAVTAGLLFL